VLGLHVLTSPPHWHERRFHAMGSPAHLIAGGAHEPLVQWAVDEVERLEQCWSRFRPTSEVSQLMANAGEWVPVSADLLEVLVRARSLWKSTAGAFDPTVLPALRTLGYDRTFRAVAPKGIAAELPPGPAPGFGAVEIDDDARAIRLAPGTGLDFGGIGKGLAADLLVEGLLLRGASSALVGLGGDIRAAGVVPDGGWRIPVLDPFDAGSVWREVVLGTDAVVTSTSLMRRWTRGGHDLHHIIDPLSGWPADAGVVAVVAQGPAAWWAEGLAKAAMVLGEAGAPTLLQGTGVTATLFRSDRTTAEISDEAVTCSPR
jgi:thiamine biosynthesis lipoprotein